MLENQNTNSTIEAIYITITFGESMTLPAISIFA